MANKKISFELDINGKPIDVVIDKTLNLKQAVRELTKELNKTQEGTDEFRLLSNKLNETKDNVDRVNAKSREFFSTLSLLPGPIGDFSNKIDGSISLLKTFSGFKLGDIKNQLKGLVSDLADIASSISKATGLTKAYSVLNNVLAKSFVAVGIGEEAAALGAKAFSAALIATGIGALVVGLGLAIDALMRFVSGEKEAEEANNKLAESFRMLKKSADDTQDAIKNQTDVDIIYAKAAGKSEEELTKIRQKGIDDRKAANDRALKEKDNAGVRLALIHS